MAQTTSTTTMNHPAAEIVAIALRKVCKLAGNRRQLAPLVEQCKELQEALPTLVPPPSASTAPADAGASAPPDSARPGATEGPAAPVLPSLAAHPSLQDALKEGDNVAASHTAGGSGGGAMQTLEQRHPQAAAVKAHFEAEDIAEATADFTVPSLTSPGGSTGVAAAGAAPGPTPAASEAADGGAAEGAAAEEASVPVPEVSESDASAVTPVALAAGSPPPPEVAAPGPAAPAAPEVGPDGNLRSGVAAADAVSTAAAAELLPAIMPRTSDALPDAVCGRVLTVLRAAIEAGIEHNVVSIPEVCLDCIQKLIAFRFLQGSAYAIDLDKQGGVEAGDGASLHDPAMSTPQAVAVELMCRCDEIPDEGVELQVLKGILTATTSATFTVHGQALLLVVRTCYNIYLMSRSDVNQTTAKAALTQMLNVVFQRMEADSVLVEVRPIAVADLVGAGGQGSRPGTAGPGVSASDPLGLGLGGAAGTMGGVGGAGSSATSSVVQSFLNNVVMVATHGQGSQELRNSVAATLRAAADDDHVDALTAASARSASRTNLAAQQAQGQVVPGPLRTPSSTSLSSAAGGLAGGSMGGAAGPAEGGAAEGGSYGEAAAAAAAEAAEAGLQAAEAARSNLLQKDAFLVFRALCKLSVRTADNAQDPAAIRGKVLALELLRLLLEGSGPTFRIGERFLTAIRQYLCVSLLKNGGSSVPAVAHLSAAVFLTLLHKFRSSLKAEVGVFLPMFLLKPFEPPAPPAGAPAAPAAAVAPSPAAAAAAITAQLPSRSLALRVIADMAVNGQLLVDLFVNYDCDLESSNLFERLVAVLVRVAQQQPVSPPPPPLMVDTSGTPYHQEQVQRVEALQALVNMVQSLLDWYRVMAGIGGDETSSGGAGTAAPAADEGTSGSGAPVGPGGEAALGKAHTSSSLDLGATAAAAAAAVALAGAGVAAVAGAEEGAAGASGGPATVGTGPGGQQGVAGEELGAKRAMKQKFQDGIALFNKKPRKGLEFLQTEGMLGRTPEEVSAFLARTTGLNKALIGDYLGERDEFNLKVMHCYVDAMEFSDMQFDDAIRAFLSGFRLPGEAQKIDRLMEKFAERFVKCNPGSFKSADVAYVLAYSVIMLNTDAHNPQVKKKMSKEGFLKNNRGINDGQDLPEDFMSSLYDRIINNEIKMKDDPALGAGGQGANKEQGPQAVTIFSTLLSMMGVVKQEVSTEPSEEAIKGTLDYLHQKAKSSVAVTVMEPDAVRPMMEVIWAPLLGALSVLFDEYADPRLIRYTLAGLAAGCSLTALLGMPALRDIFMNSLCNFTHLHSPSTMRFKNAQAFKCMLRVAEAVGDNLQERWVDVLRCISRWELLQQISSGMPTDAVLFSAPQDRGVKAVLDKARNLLRDSAGSMDSSKTMDSLAMTESSIKKVHVGGSGSAAGRKDAAGPSISAEVINSCDSHELNGVFLRSSSLSSEAIVIFVRALASISQDELRDARAPRVFSLSKIVEIAHYNMGRIRLVWSRIWSILSDYFISVGCHPNLSVAMYAVDALRQLAMKFLQRDELANYTFQNDFLRPFVVIMRQSQAVEIRELIIRCLSQMVLARVNNVKSGWKSMFMVFTTAANDRDPMIVRLAFDTIEKIVREHFSHITETETTTFTDCVNCLIAFTNNPHSIDVALNSIAFLRYCALKLAEGAIGDVNELPEGITPTDVNQHPLRVVAIESSNTSSSFPLATASSSASLSSQSHDHSRPLARAPSPSASPAAPKGGFTDLRQGAGAGAGDEGGPRRSQEEAGHSGRVSAELDGASGVLRSSSSRGPRHLKFEDKDEHVYFWFPLLAGLSELTFDPRIEIRTSALEVLFNTLKCHGGAFADSFWRRIFDSVLLPIFDHVRAEVTDTTTFTSDKRRQQEDAWLYETCTKCLQHLIDVSVLFYDETRCLLPSLTQLLRSFMERSHQSLAAVGVAAFVRLCNKAAPVMDEDAWREVSEFLVQVSSDITPNVQDLLTPPGATRPSAGGPGQLGSSASLPSTSSALSTPPFSRASSTMPEIQPVLQGGPGAEGAGAPGVNGNGGGWAAAATAAVAGVAPVGQDPSASQALASTSLPAGARPFSLREGVGARRLAKFRSHAAVQLLLVQGCSETYAGLHSVMPASATTRLLQALHIIATHARSIDMDLDLRRRLVLQQVEDRVPEERTVLDPPLLRLETEAAHAYLSVLTHMVLQRPALRPPRLFEETQAPSRLLTLCGDVLGRYVLGVTGAAAGLRQAEAAATAAAAAAQGAKGAKQQSGGFASVLLGGVRRSSDAPAAGGSSASKLADVRVTVGRSSAGLPLLMAAPSAEYASFAPLVCSVLKALSGAVEEGALAGALPTLFPLLALVVRAEYAPGEVRRALSDLLLNRVGPAIGAPAPVWAATGRS